MSASKARAGSPTGSPKGSPKKKKGKDTDSQETLRVEQDFYEVEIDQVNIIENIAATKTIFSSDYIRKMKVEPRPGDKVLSNRNLLRSPWEFNTSCFKPYQIDNPKRLKECFELDWVRMRLPRAIKDEEKKDVQDYLRSKYKYFRDAYKYLSGVSP